MNGERKGKKAKRQKGKKTKRQNGKKCVWEKCQEGAKWQKPDENAAKNNAANLEKVDDVANAAE